METDKKREQLLTRVRGVVSELIVTARSLSPDRPGKQAEIDQELIPMLQALDERDEAAAMLMDHLTGNDPQVLETIAKALIALTPLKDQDVKDAAIDEMIFLTSSVNMMPAARAAEFLLYNEQDKKNKKDIEKALQQFKERIRLHGWQKAISENIPQISRWVKS